MVGKSFCEYLRIIFEGSIFMILTMALDPLVRNDGKSKLSMNIMIAGIDANFVLDYLFVMRWDWKCQVPPLLQ